MSPDATVEILIRAIDEMSATMKNIEGSVTSMGKNVKKQTDITTNSFNKQMGTMITLGNTANTVNNIFDSYENLQLRLENSTDRVLNAQDRLRKAQSALLKVQKNVNASAEDLADAQQDVIFASRQLEMAQNNLERANNQVLNTYINIGVQVGVLISTLPTLISKIGELSTALYAFVIANPWVLAIAAAVGVLTYAIIKLNEKTKEEEANLKALTDDAGVKHETWLIETKKYQDLVTNSIQRTIDKINAEYDAIMGIIKGPIQGEAQAQLDLANQQQVVDQLRLQGLQATSEAEKSNIQVRLDEEQNKLDILQQKYDIDYTNFRTIEEAKLALNKEKNLETQGNYASTYTEIEKRIKQFADYSKIAAKEVADENIIQLGRQKSAVDDLINSYTKLISVQGGITGISQTTNPTAPGYMPGTRTDMTPKYGDFISRPGQSPVSFSSDDTIIGTKNPGGVKITIVGNIYGINPDDISEAIYQRIANKISQ